MHTTILRKSGGSVIMAVPSLILEALHIGVGATVGMDIEGDRLVVRSRRPRYTLTELLAQCNPDGPVTAEDREWLDIPSIGAEV